MAISAGRLSGKCCPGKDLILGSKSETGQFTSRGVAIQSAAVTSVGWKIDVGMSVTGMPGDART